MTTQFMLYALVLCPMLYGAHDITIANRSDASITITTTDATGTRNTKEIGAGMAYIVPGSQGGLMRIQSPSHGWLMSANQNGYTSLFSEGENYVGAQPKSGEALRAVYIQSKGIMYLLVNQESKTARNESYSFPSA